MDSPRFHLTLNPDGYYELSIAEDVFELTIQDVKAVAEAAKKIGGQRLPTLVTNTTNVVMSAETMSYLAKNENYPFSSAGAYVVSSASQKLLSNFYVKLKRPERPTKFFSSREEAVKWIMDLKDK